MVTLIKLITFGNIISAMGFCSPRKLWQFRSVRSRERKTKSRIEEEILWENSITRYALKKSQQTRVCCLFRVKSSLYQHGALIASSTESSINFPFGAVTRSIWYQILCVPPRAVEAPWSVRIAERFRMLTDSKRPYLLDDLRNLIVMVKTRGTIGFLSRPRRLSVF